MSASASDNVGVAGVQFKLDGTNLGAELTAAPFSMSDPQNYYLIYRRAGGSSVLRISRIVNGTETVLASASIPNPVRHAFFHLTGRATATTLTLELDGVSKLSVSDSRFSSGRVGVFLGSSGRASHRADNFSASAQ